MTTFSPSFFIHLPWNMKLPRNNLGSNWFQPAVRKMTLAFFKSTKIFPAYLLVVFKVHHWQIFSTIIIKGKYSRDNNARQNKYKVRVISHPWSSVQNYSAENCRKYQVKTKKRMKFFCEFLWYLLVSDMHSACLDISKHQYQVYF